MRRMVLTINLKILGDILQIPDGAEIVFAVQRVDSPDVLEMYVRGVGPEIPDSGVSLPREALVVHEFKAVKIDWPTYSD